MQIGSATENLTIGAVGSTGHGLVVRGGVQGAGVYDGVNAVGIAIGGQGGSVSLAGGITLDGSVSAEHGVGRLKVEDLELFSDVGKAFERAFSAAPAS